MKAFTFRRKVLLLAVGLVIVIELGTLLPVLRAIKDDVDAEAQRSVSLAGVISDEFMNNRTAQLSTTVEAVASDFPFREAVALGDPQSVLANHAARAGAAVAIVFDLDGAVIAVAGDAVRDVASDSLPKLTHLPDLDGVHHSVAFINDVPYQTVTVPIRAPLTIAWATFGFPIDAQLAGDIRDLTGLHASFVGFAVDDVRVFASTLPEDERSSAVSDIHLGNAERARQPIGSHEYLTSLRPFLEEPAGLYVALQLSMRTAAASYRNMRSILVLITSSSLLLAVAGAFWLARMVTRPVQDLAAAARRMRAGIYTQSLSVASSDELGELAAGFNAMQEAIAEREEHIFHIAHHDGLSGLPTRELIVSQLREKMAQASRLAVVNFALSRFDGIVSSLGHRTADEVIQLVATLLRNMTTADQLLGHVNHHEFILVLPDFTVERASQFVERLADMLRAGVVVNRANISLQARAGIACFPEHGDDPTELLRCAGIARNDAQHRHEPIVEYRIDQENRAVELIRIVGDFPQALQNDELELEFQPKIDCTTREVVGAEALVRWRHPELGLLPPGKFIEAIEQAGSVAHLTRWILRHALMQCAAWRAHGVNVAIAVNISVDDLLDEYLPYYMLDLTKRHALKPADVTLEVTESAIMHRIEMALAVISCMRELGFRVAIDDFGTGQSAMAQLKRIPVDELKIDKSFVINMEDRHDEAIVRTSIELAHQFGLRVVAEGVENARALERLRALGCEYAQGYFIAKPLKPTEFPAWVHAWSKAQMSDIVALARAESQARIGGAGS